MSTTSLHLSFSRPMPFTSDGLVHRLVRRRECLTLRATLRTWSAAVGGALLRSLSAWSV